MKTKAEKDNKFETLLWESNIESYIKENREMYIDKLKKRLDLIPSKLFKYRTCSEYNIKAFEDAKIWFSTPTECDDKVDYTINFDLATQGKNFNSFMKQFEYDLIMFFIKAILVKNKINIDVEKMITKENLKEIKNYCYTKNGRLIKSKALDIYKKNSNATTKEILNILSLTEYALSKNNNELEKMVNSIIQTINDINKILREKNMVHCLTEDNNNDYMWNYYADMHKGFCIEYQFDNIENVDFESLENIQSLYMILYGDKKEYNIFSFFEQATKELILDDKSKKLFHGDIQLEFFKQLLTKKKEWEQQKEWRIIRTFNEKRLYDFNFISAIYLGMEIDESNKNLLINIAKEKSIKVYLQKYNTSRSKIVFEEYKI